MTSYMTPFSILRLTGRSRITAASPEQRAGHALRDILFGLAAKLYSLSLSHPSHLATGCVNSLISRSTRSRS